MCRGIIVVWHYLVTSLCRDFNQKYILSSLQFILHNNKVDCSPWLWLPCSWLTDVSTRKKQQWSILANKELKRPRHSPKNENITLKCRNRQTSNASGERFAFKMSKVASLGLYFAFIAVSAASYEQKEAALCWEKIWGLKQCHVWNSGARLHEKDGRRNRATGPRRRIFSPIFFCCRDFWTGHRSRTGDANLSCPLLWPTCGPWLVGQDSSERFLEEIDNASVKHWRLGMSLFHALLTCF